MHYSSSTVALVKVGVKKVLEHYTAEFGPDESSEDSDAEGNCVHMHVLACDGCMWRCCAGEAGVCVSSEMLRTSGGLLKPVHYKNWAEVNIEKRMGELKLDTILPEEVCLCTGNELIIGV
jgi:hypothetical protein